MPSQFLENQQPKEVWAQITRATKILMLVASLLVLDTFNRQMSLYDSYDVLPGVLYDFSVKYKDPLIKWYRTSFQGSKTRDIIIPFERRYFQGEPTPGYYPASEVPLLDPYLRERVPALGAKSRLFFGYEMAWQVYSFFMLYFPTTILLYLGWKLARLKRLWLTSAVVGSRFVTDLPFFRSSKWTAAVSISETFIGMTLLLSIVFIMRALLWWQFFGFLLPIKGKLYIEPLSVPVIESSKTLLLVPASETFLMQLLFPFVADVGVLVVMSWMLLRKRRAGQT